ncbi:MAG: Gfo/Idh/MocA family protein [Sulfurovaceae bacterium]
MKVLIVGFGSIGKRHFEILNAFDNIGQIDIVSKQKIDNLTIYSEIQEIQNINVYDYFIIASETSKHYNQLKYICSRVNEKKILVEKPLYDKKYENFECNNKIFTAYNLRFHPVIATIKNLIEYEQVYYVNVICGQYLPSWRPEQDYRKSYSADINQGGGVARDLSHELDYVSWLFGEVEKMDSINTKISDLEINSDDICTAIAITKNKSIINLTVDYISKVPIRRLIIHTKNNTIEADIIKNNIIVYDKSFNVRNVEIIQIDKNYTYTKMHQAILDNDFETVCSYHEGKKIIEIINNIEFKEL